MSVDFAFLDSGIGGIPYLLFLQEKQQNANCIYYADTKNFPYGQKSSEQIIENATIATQKIIEKWNPGAIILACNTISVTALEELRKRFPNVPFVGTVPAIKPAATISKTKKIGLFWQGNKRVFKNRSIPFDEIKKLLSEPYKFYSFQIDNSEKHDNLINLSDYINDYSDTASLLKQIDLLITIDSSIAHMAGALGVKTFLLLPYTPEWRWYNDDKKTRWYDSITIFKQTKIGNWASVIERVKNAIK